MKRLRFHIPLVALLVASLSAPAVPVRAQQDDEKSVRERFDEISGLRAQGEFEKAAQALRDLIAEHLISDEILRRAYNELIFTLLQKSSDTIDPDEQTDIYNRAKGYAESALGLFPDLSADPALFGPQVNLLYNAVRVYMFVKLEIATSPDSCRVFINDVDHGTTPVTVRYFPVGEATVVASRSGYRDRTLTFNAAPGADIRQEIVLSQERSKKWWLTRVIAPVTAGVGVLVAVLLQPEDQPPPDEPLPGPPAPPTTQTK